MALKVFAFIFVAVSILHEAHLQISKIGTCPKEAQPMKDFKYDNFSGVWYESMRYPSVQIMGRCVSINYKANEKGSSITTSQIMPGMNTTTSVSTHGRGNATWIYRMTLGLVSTNATFMILDTDYKNYALMYSCADFFNFSSLQYAWIYYRNRNISTSGSVQLAAALEKQTVINKALFVATDQTSC